MKLLLFGRHFDAFNERVGPLQATTEYFASASADEAQEALVDDWLVRASRANLHHIQDVLTGLSERSRDPERTEILPLINLVEVIRTSASPSLHRSTDWLAWLMCANAALANGRTTRQFLDRINHLPALVPTITATLDKARFDITLPTNLWPIGAPLGLTSRPGQKALVATNGRGLLTLACDGVVIDLLHPHFVEGSVQTFVRHRVPGGPEVTRPCMPYHSRWNHKFNHLTWTPMAPLLGSVTGSFKLIEQAWREAAALRGYAQRIVAYVPVDRRRHSSASAAELPFAQVSNVVLGDEYENALSFLHEAMHSKLAVLMSARRLHEHGRERAFRHPWMDVARPAEGVLLGAHAFVNIMVLARRILQNHPGWSPAERTLDRRRPEVRQALEELRRMTLTADGDAFVTRLEELFQEAEGL